VIGATPIARRSVGAPLAAGRSAPPVADIGRVLKGASIIAITNARTARA
jgi:hypothetical protein